MDIKPKKKVSHNVEDTYATLNRKDHIDIDDIPETCDVKESLINKLEELDNKIYHLLRSNKYFEEEMQNPENQEDPEVIQEFKDFKKENDDIILNSKDQIIRIMNAFIKAGTNIERDIYPKMKYRSMYMNDKEFEANQNQPCGH